MRISDWSSDVCSSDLKVSQERAKLAGCDDRVQFHLRDYREDSNKYDRIVSVGMFEHVGKKNYPEFFRKVSDLLDDDGVFVLHAVGRVNDPGPRSEEHTSELQSLMRISYAVFCLNKKI